MFVVVCYDIPDNKRRAKVGETLEGFGYRVQKSVFECEINADQCREMQERITKDTNPSEDSVRYYFLCQSCLSNIRICGLGEVQRDKPYFVV